MLFLSTLIKDATYFSAEKHDGQYRKGTHVPYIVHPFLVASGVATYSPDEHVIAAALLHDVLEDCDVSKEELAGKFGERVASLVEDVSFLEPDDNLSWKEKKEKYIQKIKTISKDGLIIVAVDKMSNMKSYFEAIASDPQKVSLLFKQDPDQYRWYYQEIGNILRDTLGEHPVVTDYFTVLQKNNP